VDRIRRRNNLCDRQVEIDVRLEIDLLNRNTVERLCLDISDVVDVGADRILAVGCNALLHFGRAEAGVLPDHCDDGNVDLRKDVNRHDANGRDAEEEDGMAST
jgi:hypothetical protein